LWLNALRSPKQASEQSFLLHQQKFVLRPGANPAKSGSPAPPTKHNSRSHRKKIGIIEAAFAGWCCADIFPGTG
jgi:hypothetical protein